MSRIPEIRVYSPQDKRGTGNQQPTRFNWQTPTRTSGNSGSLSAHHHSKVDSQPLRFFGSSHFNSLINTTGKSCHKPAPETKTETVKWENAFNMRSCNLANFPCSVNSYRATYRSQTVALQRARAGFISGTAKSLDLLRQNLQKSINKEIDDVLQKYLEKFFKLAIENIKMNNGENSVSDHHVHTVCRQILEEAKKMYQGNFARGNSPSTEYLEAESNASESKVLRALPKTVVRKRKDSDTDSEVSVATLKQKKKKGRPPLNHGTASGRSTPMKLKTEQVKREGPKWDPARLTSETQFIMGAKANKALGLGATRGRLYIKHPEVFKYSGDQEDKQWLYDHSLMPATGGKAYMLIVDDIKELAKSDEYKNNPALMMKEIVGFTVPEIMLQKMRTMMQQMRTDTPVRKRGRPPASNIDSSSERSIKTEDTTSEGKREGSGTATPTDDIYILSTDIPSTEPSPFSLGTGFDDVSPVQADISPSPSDVSASLEPPLSAPFEISTTP